MPPQDVKLSLLLASSIQEDDLGQQFKRFKKPEGPLENLNPVQPNYPDTAGGRDNTSVVIVLHHGDASSLDELTHYLKRHRWVKVAEPAGYAGKNKVPFLLKLLEGLKALNTTRSFPNEPEGCHLFTKSPSAPPHETGGSFLQPKNEFLRYINYEIEKHLDDEEFRACHIAREMRVCEMQLHRKLKKFTCLSPANYIRKYRLWRSRTFLMEPGHSISQVSFMVGFRSLEYFSRSFKKEFNICPSDFRQQYV